MMKRKSSHILENNNALKEELKDVPTVAKFATVQKEDESLEVD